MVFKINISDKSGKTYKLELESEDLIGKSLHDEFDGKEILPALEGYELEITGTSDKSGFTSHKDVEGVGLKKVLFTSYQKGMKKKPRKEGKKKTSNTNPKGLRLRKTMRGVIISPAISQINLTVLKTGAKTLSEAFPDQNKPKEAEVKPEEVKKEEAAKEEIKAEKPIEAKVEETKLEEPKKEEAVKEEIKEEPKKEEKKVEKADPEEEADFEEKLVQGAEEAAKEEKVAEVPKEEISAEKEPVEDAKPEELKKE